MRDTLRSPGATEVVVRQAPLHPVSREHLETLTGEFGILQHAIGSQPDPAHGYCVDDVARALEVDLLQARVLGWQVVASTAWRSLQFLEDAFDSTTHRFGNFRSIDGTWIGGPGSDDSCGRAMLGLARAIASAPDPDLARRANSLFDRALPEAARLASLRAQASITLACAAAPDARRGVVMRVLAASLAARFANRSRPGWPWPETVLTYENARLPHALIVAGDSLGSTPTLTTGLQVLDWLIEVQTEPEGYLSPIGNGWWPYNGTKSDFDQQPIEPTALLLASEAALDATGEQRYRDSMERAYAWFLGGNRIHRRMADPARGACFDGLTRDGVNANQGAESTLMWLMAAEHIRSIRSADRDAEATRARSRSS